MTELKGLQARLAETDLVGFAVAPEQSPTPAASKVGATKPPAGRVAGGAKMGATKDVRPMRNAAKLGLSKVGLAKMGATKPTRA